MRPSGKAGPPRWTGWLTQFGKTTGLSTRSALLHLPGCSLSILHLHYWTWPCQKCQGNEILKLRVKSRTWRPTEPSLNHPSAHLWLSASRTPHEQQQQHGGPFPADLARRGMLLGTIWILSFFSSVFGTLPERCKYFFPVLTKYCNSANNSPHLGAGNCSKKGISLSFLNCVSYKLHWLCWTYYFSKEIF